MKSVTMRRIFGVAVVPIAAAALVTAPAAAGRSAPTNTLTAGHALTAGTARDSLTSRGGSFVLRVASDFVSLDEIAWLPGPRGSMSLQTGVWFRDDGTGLHQSDHDRTQLYLSTRGNLVLRTSKREVLWSAHTRAGARSKLVLHAGGLLALYTAGGRRVWQSHTTSVLLTAGEKLAPGQRVISRWGDQNDPTGTTTLVMQRNGNLTFSCKGSVQWSSRTHVAGSYLVMQPNGNLVIRTPRGRAVWSTHTRGTYVYFSPLAVNRLTDNRMLWLAKYPALGESC
jgi:hypothetical protein